MRKSLWHNYGLPALILPVLCMSSTGAAQEYGLPVTLDLSAAEVRNVLGAPTEAWETPHAETDSLEWYYSRGIVGGFRHDKLSSVTLYKEVNYRGFIPYSGTIINGVKLTDTKAAVLKKLGTPSKVENEDVPADTDPDKPVRWPLESTYYWRFTDYEVRAAFLNQAQGEGGTVASPKDTISDITIQKLGHEAAHH